VKLLPGQFIFSQRKAAKELKMGRQEIRTALAFLIKAGNLTHKSTNHYSILTITNWHTYQSEENASNPLSNPHLTRTQPTLARKRTSGADSQHAKERKEIKDIYKGKIFDVYTHWTITMNRQQAKLTRGRKAKVRARLKEGYTVAEFKQAIDGCKASAYHMGQNDQRTVYDDLTLICRNGEKVEFFIEKAKSNESLFR
jgi:uncharacterized phage protein (TIGR02220 family)